METLTLLELFARFEDMAHDQFLVVRRGGTGYGDYVVQRGCTIPAQFRWLEYEIRRSPSQTVEQWDAYPGNLSPDHLCSSCKRLATDHFTYAQVDEIIDAAMAVK